jgi:hypothetical protein
MVNFIVMEMRKEDEEEEEKKKKTKKNAVICRPKLHGIQNSRNFQ